MGISLKERNRVVTESCKARLKTTFPKNLLTNYEDVKSKPVYRRGTSADVASTTPPFFPHPRPPEGRVKKKERDLTRNTPFRNTEAAWRGSCEKTMRGRQRWE